MMDVKFIELLMLHPLVFDAFVDAWATAMDAKQAAMDPDADGMDPEWDDLMAPNADAIEPEWDPEVGCEEWAGLLGNEEWRTAALGDELVRFLRHLGESGFGWMPATGKVMVERQAAKPDERKCDPCTALVREFLDGYRALYNSLSPTTGTDPVIRLAYAEEQIDLFALYDPSTAEMVCSITDVEQLYSRLRAIIAKEGLRAACDTFRKEGTPALAILHEARANHYLVALLKLATKKEGVMSVINSLCDIGGCGLSEIAQIYESDAKLAAALDLDYEKHIRDSLHPINRLRWADDPAEIPCQTEREVRLATGETIHVPGWLPKEVEELWSRRESMLSIGPENIRTMLEVLAMHASSAEVRARNGFPTFSDWFLSELEKRPRLLLKFYERELPERMAAFATIIGGGDAMCLAKCHAALVADSEYSVLLLGESGTGKELFARAIHENSARKGKAFVAVNCAAIPDELFEAEMFGAVKGAGSGTSAREGLFRKANGGTIFLDEIGECQLAHQTKLLRAIQPLPDSGPCQLCIRAVGAEEDAEINVRVIAGTNRNLLERAREKLFRSDLYYRLATVILKLPPLRDRGDSDLRRLTGFLWGRINKELAELAELAGARSNYQAKRLDESAYARIMEHSWPGNVRELKNVLRQAAVMSLGSVVVRGNIDAAIAEIPEHSKTGVFNQGWDPDSGLDLDKQTILHADKFIRAAVEDALGKSANVNQASKLLGLSRENLTKKIKRLNIEVPDEKKPKPRPRRKPKSNPPADRSS
jgi:DNA-binding NtrC family response regulator